MPAFTLYLIKDGFDITQRLFSDDGTIRENINSVFDIKVIIESRYEYIDELEKRKLLPVIITKAESSDIIYYKINESHKPWWKDFWHIADEIEIQNASAVIFKKFEGKLFAFTHGFGRYLLNSFAIEYDFGLRIAVNLIDDSKIRTAGLFTPSEIGLSTIKHSGKSAKINEFDINTFNTMLKNVAGNVKKEYQKYFKTISGADSINFSYAGNREGLFDVSKMLYSKSILSSYKQTNFYWIDNFKPIRDESKIQELDKILIDEINRKNSDIILIYPGYLSKGINVYFNYSGIPNDIPNVLRDFPCLDIEEQYYSILGDYKISSAIEIKTHQISVIDLDSGFAQGTYSLYQCIYFEIINEGQQYYFENGIWYRITQDFYNQINENYLELLKEKMDLDFQYDRRIIRDTAHEEGKSKEFIFNRLLVDHLSQYGTTELLDTKTIMYKKNPIEICDVLSKQDEMIFLIHNKYKYGSSALSHLFSQGYVSADSILDKEFRKNANQKIANTDLLFDEGDNLNRKKFIVVYGIITRKNKRGIFDIPVFSKINLKLFSDSLKKLDFKIRISFFEDIETPFVRKRQ
jgi:uncharacterized protein (TIGR04141 family)